MESNFKIIPLTKTTWKDGANISCIPGPGDATLMGCGGGGCNDTDCQSIIKAISDCPDVAPPYSPFL